MKRFVRTLLIVLLTLVLSWFVVYDLGSISYFAPMEKASDYETSDFYQTVAASRPVRRLCDKVVLVPVDGLSRAEIAEVISQVAFCAPAATGVDLLFGYPQPGTDEELREAIASLPVAVVPDTSAYIYADVPGLRQGGVELEAESRLGTIRRYRSAGSMAGELALASGRAPVAAGGLLEFGFYDFETVYPGEILDSETTLNGAIVLIGTLADVSDMHPTAVGADTPGMLIHATAIASMLAERPVRTPPEWFDWLLAVVLCAAFVHANLRLKEREGGELLMRLLQLGMLLMITAAGTLLYLHLRVNVNFGRPLLMVGTAALSVDVWCGAMALRRYMRNKTRKKEKA